MVSRIQQLVRSLAMWPTAAVVIVVFCSASVVQGQNIELNEETFNQWLFQASQGVFDGKSELTLVIESVDSTCGLSDDQKTKLTLAGSGDYTRFERQVDKLRQKFVGKTYGQNEFGEIYQQIQPLAQTYQAGLLGDDSLFSKVLLRTLDDEQAAKYKEADSERRAATYAAKVRHFVVTLERTCPLTDKQRKAIVDLVLQETKPPNRFGQYDWYAVMYQAHKIPDEQYEPIVDAAQLAALRRALAQGAGMKHFLIQQKIIDE